MTQGVGSETQELLVGDPLIAFLASCAGGQRVETARSASGSRS